DRPPGARAACPAVRAAPRWRASRSGGAGTRPVLRRLIQLATGSPVAGYPSSNRLACAHVMTSDKTYPPIVAQIEHAFRQRRTSRNRPEAPAAAGLLFDQ